MLSKRLGLLLCSWQWRLLMVQSTPAPTAMMTTIAPTPLVFSTPAPTSKSETPAPSSAATSADTTLVPTIAPSVAQSSSSRPTSGSTEAVTAYPTVFYPNCPNVTDVMTVNFGYYQSLAAYRAPDCYQLLPEDIDVAGGGYTHLAYAFVGIDGNHTLVPWDSDYETEVPMYKKFNGLKKKFPNLKTVAVIGGWTFNNPGPTQPYFSEITNSASLRAKFAASVVEFMEKYDFDGVDIDWEFPGRKDRGGNSSDFQNLPLMIKAIRDACNKAGKTDAIISLATPPAVSSLSLGFDLPELSKYVDFFTILAYEIHGPWDPVVGAITDFSYVRPNVDYIMSAGVPPNQVVLGLAGFGHTYNLTDPTCNEAGCPFSNVGPGGCGGNPGTMPDFSIQEIIDNGQYDVLRFNNKSACMEMVVNESIWFSFDNEETWNVRTTYAEENCMRGYFWWAIDMLQGPVPLSPRAGPKPIPPTPSPTGTPSSSPSVAPSTLSPTSSPSTPAPTAKPSHKPTREPTLKPTKTPSAQPTTLSPTQIPTIFATRIPSRSPASGSDAIQNFPASGSSPGYRDTTSIPAIVLLAFGFLFI